jgi:superfamily II DNA or RNA helicase
MNYLYNYLAFDAGGQTDLQVYQAMVKYSVSPFSTEKRYLFKFGTGLGKTYSALLALKNFVDVGLVPFVVSFQREIFEDEAIKFKMEFDIEYFGYIELGNRLVN